MAGTNTRNDPFTALPLDTLSYVSVPEKYWEGGTRPSYINEGGTTISGGSFELDISADLLTQTNALIAAADVDKNEIISKLDSNNTTTLSSLAILTDTEANDDFEAIY